MLLFSSNVGLEVFNQVAQGVSRDVALIQTFVCSAYQLYTLGKT